MSAEPSVSSDTREPRERRFWIERDSYGDLRVMQTSAFGDIALDAFDDVTDLEEHVASSERNAAALRAALTRYQQENPER